MRIRTNGTNANTKDFFILSQDFFNVAPEGRFTCFHHGLFLICGGTGVIKIGTVDYRVQSGDLIAIPVGTVLSIVAADQLTFDGVFFTAATFGSSIDGTVLHSLDYFCPDTRKAVRLEETGYKKARMLFDSLIVFSESSAVVAGLLHSLLMFTKEMFGSIAMHNSPLVVGKGSLVVGFRKLVATHFKTHKDVSFYASKLNITTRYLSELLAKATGWNAKKWIDYHIRVEAKSMLLYSGSPIKEIAFELGFVDSAHFTRQFKKWEGVGPAQFRSEVIAATKDQR